jgi:protein-S-isoprenylcysteine O-methyltransferase Ste14
MDKRYAGWAARWRVPLGFALGGAYLVFAQPTQILLAAGGTVSLAGLALRAFAAGCLEKNTGLATCGPYACTRNPLYLGSFLMGSGLALAGGSWVFGVAFLGFFLLVYYPVMQREEDSLRGKFGKMYDRYAEAVPLFFPRFRKVTSAGDKFRWTRYRKNREYRAALGFVLGIVFLALKLGLR